MNTKDLNKRVFQNFDTIKKPRKNSKKEFKKERNNVIDEAIRNLKVKMRSMPKQWHRGYNSAITTLEMMKTEG